MCRCNPYKSCYPFNTQEICLFHSIYQPYLIHFYFTIYLSLNCFKKLQNQCCKTEFWKNGISMKNSNCELLDIKKPFHLFPSYLHFPLYDFDFSFFYGFPSKRLTEKFFFHPHLTLRGFRYNKCFFIISVALRLNLLLAPTAFILPLLLSAKATGIDPQCQTNQDEPKITQFLCNPG